MNKSKSKNKKNSKPVKNKLNLSENIVDNVILFFTVLVITYLISYLFFDFGVAFYYVFPFSAAFISVAMNIVSKKITPESKSASYIYIVFSVVTVALSIISILAAHNMAPFGDISIVTLDIPHQYIPFNYLLKDIITQGESLLYSHNLGLGADFYGLFAYYLSSIYNIIMLIFPKSMFLLAYSLMSFLKFITIPITFGIFYQRVFKRKDFTVVIFTLTYSLMSYIVIQITNIMWIDCIILFPLIIMYFHEMLETGVFWKYSVVLALAMLTSYYIAYMICIYLVLYYIAYVFINTDKFILKEQIKKLWKFIYSSVLAAGTAAIILIPAIYNLSKTSNLNNIAKTFEIWNFNPLLFFKQFFYFIKGSIRSGQIPNVYCSIFVLFLITLFWVCKGIPWKKKLSYSIIFLFISFSLSFYPLDSFWHGFHDPKDLPGRYAFLVSFTMIIMAIDTFNNLEGINLKALLCELIFIPLLIIMSVIDGSNALLSIIGTASFLIIYSITLILYKKSLLKKQMALLLSLVLVFIEMTTSAVITRDFETDKYPEVDFLTQALNSYNEIITEIKENDDEIYRIENIPHVILNDSAFTGTKTLSCFSSTNNYKAINFMNNIGYKSNLINSYTYESSLPFIDSILGLKYFISINEEDYSPFLKFLYKKTIGERTFNVYENKLFIGLGYAVPNEIKNWNINDINQIEAQNNLAQILIKKDIFERIPVNSNITIESDGRYYFINNIKTKEILEYSLSNNPKNNEISKLTAEYKELVDFGNLKSGQKIELTLNDKDDAKDCYLYKLNDDILVEAIEKINSAPYEIETFKNTYIKGSINMKENGTMFLSIVNDGGWTVTVDGKETEITEIADCFIGIPLEAGKHTVEFHYHNYSVLIGAVITLISLGIIIFITLIQKKKKYKNSEKEIKG